MFTKIIDDFNVWTPTSENCRSRFVWILCHLKDQQSLYDYENYEKLRRKFQLNFFERLWRKLKTLSNPCELNPATRSAESFAFERAVWWGWSTLLELWVHNVVLWLSILSNCLVPLPIFIVMQGSKFESKIILMILILHIHKY